MLFLDYHAKSMEEQKRTLERKGIECSRINASNTPGTCKPTWDSIMCWPETEPGQYRILTCADYFFGFDPMKNATKFCNENGSWNNWTNYTQCLNGTEVTETVPFGRSLDSSLETYVQVLTDISTAGYSISMVSLIFAFSILASIRTLWCPRNILHMHLFFSFIMRAFVFLLKETIFVLSVGLPNNVELRSDKYVFIDKKEGTFWDCKLVISIWNYFFLANYSWILMEALYLHNLVFKALFTDKSSVTFYIILGWGLPFLFLIPWIIGRIFLEDELCWTLNKNVYIYAIIYIPVSVSNIICFIIFIRLVKVIFTKLQSSVCEQTQIYRRLAKSTLALLPLFGVHYIVFLAVDWYKFTESEMQAELMLLIFTQLFNSFQGFLVALFYCFLNSEVRTELNKSHFQWSHRRRRNTDASDGKAILSFSAAGSTDKKK